MDESYGRIFMPAVRQQAKISAEFRQQDLELQPWTTATTPNISQLSYSVIYISGPSQDAEIPGPDRWLSNPRRLPEVPPSPGIWAERLICWMCSQRCDTPPPARDLHSDLPPLHLLTGRTSVPNVSTSWRGCLGFLHGRVKCIALPEMFYHHPKQLCKLFWTCTPKTAVSTQNMHSTIKENWNDAPGYWQINPMHFLPALGLCLILIHWKFTGKYIRARAGVIHRSRDQIKGFLSPLTTLVIMLQNPAPTCSFSVCRHLASSGAW